MKRLIAICLVTTLGLTGLTSCQSSTTESTNTTVSENLAVAETVTFGDDLVFTEQGDTYSINLDESSDLVKSKHEKLSQILNNEDTLKDITAITTTTANILYQAGIIPTGAPESQSLKPEIVQLQYVLENGQQIDKTKVLNIGSAIAPNIEAIIELNPQLVLYSDAMPKTDFLSNLESTGLTVESLGQSDYIDMFVLLDVINQVTDYKDVNSKELMSSMVNQLKATNEIIQNANEQNQTVAILQVLEGSIRVNNDETVLGGIVKAIGMDNVFATSENAELNKEQLLTMNPDYIIYYGHGMGSDAITSFETELNNENSIYRDLDAVKNGNALQVASDDFVFSASVDFEIIKIINFLAEEFYE